MLSFRQYVKYLKEATDTKTGNYVSVDAAFPEFVQQLKKNSGTLSNNAHITLVYSKEQTQDPDEILRMLNSKFNSTGVVDFDCAACFDGEDDTACVVLKLKSDKLQEIHDALISIGDIKHSYDDYSPHLTIFYDVDKDEAAEMVDHINTNHKNFNIRFQGFDSTTVIKDWQK